MFTLISPHRNNKRGKKMNAVRKYDILNNDVYDISILRNDSESIRNDPFGLGNTVKGLTSVNHQRNLSNYAEELVAQYAKYDGACYELSLDALSEYDQNELARLYIESTGREVNECIYGDDFTINNEFTCSLLAMLENDCQETREHFAEKTRNNILTYYKKSLDELLVTTCDNYLHAVNNENGYHACQDMEHGDIVWRKS